MAADLPEYIIAKLQELYASGESTAVKMCEAFLTHISEIDRAGPCLSSVIEINPDALRIAAELTRSAGAAAPGEHCAACRC